MGKKKQKEAIIKGKSYLGIELGSTRIKAVLIDELGCELKNYNKKVVFIGDGSVLCYEKLKDVVTDCDIADENIRYIHASSIGRIAEEKVMNGELPIDSVNLVPYYLRLPQAERELNNKNSLKKENIK